MVLLSLFKEASDTVKISPFLYCEPLLVIIMLVTLPRLEPFILETTIVALALFGFPGAPTEVLIFVLSLKTNSTFVY